MPVSFCLFFLICLLVFSLLWLFIYLFSFFIYLLIVNTKIVYILFFSCFRFCLFAFFVFFPRLLYIYIFFCMCVCVCLVLLHGICHSDRSSLFFFYFFCIINRSSKIHAKTHTHTAKKKTTSSSVVSLNRSVRIIFCFFDFSQKGSLIALFRLISKHIKKEQ